jgi:PAS domain-containing protein
MTISSRLARTLGLPERQTCLSAKEWEAFIFPNDMPLIANALQAAIQTERPIDVEHRLLVLQGNVLWVASRGVLSKDEAGKPTRVGGVIVDITEKTISRSRFVLARNDTGTSWK